MSKNDFDNSQPSEELPEVAQELSQVATNPKQSMVILVGIGLVFIYLIFNLFWSSGSDEKKEEALPVPKDVAKPIEASDDSAIPPIPTLPEPPKLEDPTPPPPPPATIVAPVPLVEESLPSLPTAEQSAVPLPPNSTALALPFGGSNNEEAKKRLEAKRKSSIVLVGGAPPAKTPEQIEQEADFKFRGDMSLVLGRGKIIDAIVESAINTDFGGEIRAIINRDIYSEWGKNILIPKGSRVYGSYTTGVSGAYGRVTIDWTHLDLSNGYIVNLSGSAQDGLGRKGIQGRVDNKVKEQITNTVLKSAFNVVLAQTIDSLVKPQTSTQAAADQTATASNIRNTAAVIMTDSTNPSAQKRINMCGSVLNAISDKTSTAFTNIQTACNTLATQTGATDDQKLQSLFSTINSAADSLLVVTNSTVQESKAQEAAKTAYTDIAESVKKIIETQEFKPTITIDQGTLIKIYVNKDYKFPKAAVMPKASQ